MKDFISSDFNIEYYHLNKLPLKSNLKSIINFHMDYETESLDLSRGRTFFLGQTALNYFQVILANFLNYLSLPNINLF